VAVSAFAARFPFETWVLPKEHGSCYEDMPEAELHELAAIFRRLIVEIEAVAPRVAYNYILHTAPFDTAAALHYHWHIEVIPSLTRAAGFEMGSGFFVNPVPPEEATLRLRQVDREKGTGTFCAKHPKGR
jgi:UDPglucose--hexose-1-phosphate uridylyltransferase